MSTVTFIIFFSLADFCTAFPKDFPISRDNWSDCSELWDFTEPEEWVWADSAVRVKVGSSHEMALLASSSDGFCPWRCSDIWLSLPVRAHTHMNLRWGMKKEEHLSPSLPFCFPSPWASMPRVYSPLSVSDHGDRQVMLSQPGGHLLYQQGRVNILMTTPAASQFPRLSEKDMVRPSLLRWLIPPKKAICGLEIPSQGSKPLLCFCCRLSPSSQTKLGFFYFHVYKWGLLVRGLTGISEARIWVCFGQ